MKSLEQIRQPNAAKCFYSANTIWWTDDANDLHPGPVPLDVFNSPLLESDKVQEFFDEQAIRSHKSYGKYPLTVYTASHAKNLEFILEKYNNHFPGKLQDVSSMANFAARIEAMVEAKLIPNLDEKELM